MSDRITPRTAIRDFLDVATISRTAVNQPRTRRVRRSSETTVGTSSVGYIGGDRKRTFSEVTPRTLIQGVLATTEAVPDTARKRTRTTPRTKPPAARVKALTPASATRSKRRAATRLDVLATPGGSNPTPRSLIQGLINAAPIETPWQVTTTVARRTSPRHKPNFPVVTETLQTQAQGLTLSPYIKDSSSSIQRPGRKLRTGLRRAINREQFAKGIAEKLSQEAPPEGSPATSRELSVLGSFVLESIHEENSEIEDEDDDVGKDDDERGVQDEEEEDDIVGKDGNERGVQDELEGQQVEDRGDVEEDSREEVMEEEEEKDSQDGDDILDSIDADEEQDRDQGDENQQEENSAEDELDAADQSTLDAAGVMEAAASTMDVSAGGDGAQYMSIEGAVHRETDEDDDAVVATQPAPSASRFRGIDTMLLQETNAATMIQTTGCYTQPAPSANRFRGIDTMLLQETNAATMIQTTLDGYSPLVTPRIAAGRAHKTPALKKTPAPLRDKPIPNRTELTSKAAPAAKKTAVPRQPQQKKQPELPYTLPQSLTKSIFTHFSKCKVSKEAMTAVMQGSNAFFKRISDDLAIYASHAHRTTIEPADVELLMRRQRLINDKESLHSLIEKHLPMEYRQELIPVARSGNKVVPKI